MHEVVDPVVQRPEDRVVGMRARGKRQTTPSPCAGCRRPGHMRQSGLARDEPVPDLLTIACTASGEPLPVIAVSTEALDAFPAASLTGTVIEQDGCIRVRSDRSPSNYLPVWQPGHRIQRSGERLEIVDRRGEVVARVGEPIDLGGGEWPSAENYLATPLPPACTGPYWMASPEP